MTTTPNLGLTKDAPNEQYSIERVNANSDRIDGFAGDVNSALAAKQDTISDLSEIRSGAAAGSTAVQPTELETDQARQETEIGVVANAGAKNLLNPLLACGYMSQGTQYPITVGGVTFTLNADGSITTTGSSTATRVLRIPITVPAGSYRATGCPSGGSSSSYRIDYRESGTETFIGGVDTGNGVTLTFDEDKTFDFCLRISANYSQSATFYPMLHRAEITDDTFVPYAPTNRELYEMILALQNGA